MPLSVVQAAGGNTGTTTTDFNTGIPYTISKAFGADNVGGNTIIVILGFDQGNIAYGAPLSVTDTQGNTYNLLSNTIHGTNTGPGLAVYIARNIDSGPNTVTATCSVNWAGFGSFVTRENTFIIVAEIAGLGSSPSLQGANAFQTYTTYTGTMTVTDSHSVAVSLQVTTVINDSCWCLVDLLGTGGDFIFGCGLAGGAPGSETLIWTPSGYAQSLLISNLDTTDTNISNGAGPTPAGSYLVLYAGPTGASFTVDCDSPPDGTVGTSYSHAFPASGGTSPYTFSVLAGTLPPGLGIDPSTGIVAGVPAAAGTFSFIVNVLDSLGATASVSCSITIGGMTLGCGSSANGTVGVAFSDQLVVTAGVPPYVFSILSGTLPPGLTLNPATGEITGTPTTPGTYCFEVQVTEGAPPAGTGGFTNQVTVTVVHGLNNTSLSPGVWDDSGNVIKFGTVKFTDPNTAVLTFPVAQSGSFKLSADTWQQGFVDETTVVVPHELNSLNLIPVVLDGDNNVIDFGAFELVDANNALLTLPRTQTGNLIILMPTGAYSQPFPESASVNIPHHLNSLLLRVAVYDTSNNLIAYENFGPVDANNSVLTFPAGTPQAGRVVVRVS